MQGHLPPKEPSRTVLITGVGGPAGRSSALFFREKGWYVIGTDIREVEAPVHQLMEVPPGETPEFVEFLLSFLADHEVSLLIPTVTEELPQVASVRNKIRALGVHVFIPSYRVVEIVNNKYKTAQALHQLGIPAPKTLLWKEVRGPHEAGRILGYPFVQKPVFGRGGRGVKVFRSPSKIQEENQERVVYQEFVAGEEFDVNLFAYPAGEIQAIGVLRKTQLKDGIVGNALAVEPAPEEKDLYDLAVRVVKALSLEGPIDMDIRRDAQGTPKVLEINARVGANVLHVPEVLETLYRWTLKGGAE